MGPFQSKALAERALHSIYIYHRLQAAVENFNDPIHDVEMGNENILFVDDEQIMVEIATQILSPLGYQVTPVTDALQALELFRADADHFDLIITDYTMPKLNGTELAEEIRPNSAWYPDNHVLRGFLKKLPRVLRSSSALKSLMKPFVAKDLAERGSKGA